MNDQTAVFLMSCVLGGAFGFIYDFFRITRIAIKTCKAVVFIEDILFFIIATICSFVFIMSENRGELRGLLIIGEIVGAIIYFYTISVVLIKSANIIIKLVKTIVLFLYKILIKPIICIFNWIYGKITIRIMQCKLQKLLDINLDEVE